MADTGDLADLASYFEQHAEEAREIIGNMHAYISRFADEKHERDLERVVIRRFFEKVLFEEGGVGDAPAIVFPPAGVEDARGWQ